MRGWLFLVVLGVLLLSACSVSTTRQPTVTARTSPPATFHGSWQDRPYPMPNETLTDTSGQPFNLRTSPSRPVRLVYLGFVDCPTDCVTTLSQVALALQRLHPSVRDDVDVLFVDIQPKRDTPAELGAWLGRFDSAFIGLLGSPAQTQRIADQLGVAMHDQGEDRGVVHGAQVIGFDRAGQGVMVWSPGFTSEQLTADLTQLAARQR